MGLFKKKAPETPPEQETKPEVKEIYRTVAVDLTEKMLQVELTRAEAYLEPCELQLNGDLLQITHGGILIATIVKRSKAYTELLPHVGKYIQWMTIRAASGSYGSFYKVRLRVHEGTEIL